MTKLTKLSVAMAALLAIGFGLPVVTKSLQSPETTARIEAERAAHDKRISLRVAAKRCGQSVQLTLNDPKSFELVSWSGDTKKVHIVYRARNGFNALITTTALCDINV